MSVFQELKTANENYHTAANEIFETNLAAFVSQIGEMSAEKMTEIKAKFGAFHNNIFQLMREAQTLFEPQSEGEEL